MKKYFLMYALALCALIGCKDNSGLYGLLNDYDDRISSLEQLCKQINTNVDALQTLVNAQQTGDYITAITPIKENGVEVGYTITFSKHDPVTIYHGKDGSNGKDGQNGKDGKDGQNGTNGTNGTDGHTPIIGVAKDTDGIYYWTLDGDWLLDGNGNKLRVTGEDGKDGQDGQNGQNGTNGTNGTNGVTPQLKIEGDYWFISYDNGATWTLLGKAKGDKGEDGTNGTNGQDGDSMFQSVTQDEDYVYFTLINGTLITVSKKNTTEVQIVNGAIQAPFSVSATKQVYFSQGNLQYNTVQGTHKCANGTTKKGTWRFAENQWDVIKEDNLNVSSTYDGWIDLFAWGASGYKYKPDTVYYGYVKPYPSSKPKYPVAISADIVDSYHDWGIFNGISNGGNEPRTWRTLSREEWEYIHEHSDWYTAIVNDIKGVVLLPDNYDEPIYISHEKHCETYEKAIYNLKTWRIIASQGAVFLPNGGYLSKEELASSTSYDNINWRYWSATLHSYNTGENIGQYAYTACFAGQKFLNQNFALSVRLVKDVE